MSNLTNQAPASTFGALMNTASAGGLTDILQVIQDGFGHPSPLSLSTDSLSINTQMGGGFFIDAVQLNSTATQIDSVCVDASFSAFTTALMLPNGTTAQRPFPATNGSIRYNTTISSGEMYVGNAWATIGTSSGYYPGGPTYLQDTFEDGTFNLSMGSAASNFGGGRIESTIFGDDALQTAGSGSGLVGVGYKCLKLLTTATNVTGAGHLCLSSLTTGTLATAFGKSSQEFNVSGRYNVSFGAFSLSSLTGSDSNTAIGHQSLLLCDDSLNAALGFQSGIFLETGQNNCFIGNNAGDEAQESNESCFIGGNTGGINRPYLGCIFIGHNSGAGDSVSLLTNACAIGYGSVVEVSDAIVLGDPTVPTKVGIGTSSPSQILHVENGNAVFLGEVGIGTAAPLKRLHVKGGAAYFENCSIGIGTVSPQNPLHVVGNFQRDGIVSGWTGTGVVEQQFGLVINAGATQTIDFPIRIDASGNSAMVVVRVKITAIRLAGDGSAYGTGTGAALYNSTAPGYATVPIAAPAAVTFVASDGSFTPTATWSISGSNLRLSVTADTDGQDYFVVAAEVTRIANTNL